jgi:hypothetical protein
MFTAKYFEFFSNETYKHDPENYQLEDNFIPTIFTILPAAEDEIYLYFVKNNWLYCATFNEDGLTYENAMYEILIQVDYLRPTEETCIVVNDKQFQFYSKVYDTPDGKYVDFVDKDEYMTPTYLCTDGVIKKYDPDFIILDDSYAINKKTLREHNINEFEIQEETDNDHIIAKVNNIIFIQRFQSWGKVIYALVPDEKSYYIWGCESDYDIHKLSNFKSKGSYVEVIVDGKTYVSAWFGTLVPV